MLVLSRRSGERIWIDGGRIEVKVLRVDGQRVRLGFVAPDDVSIQRDEVFRQTQLFAEVGASGDSGSINWSHTFDRS